MTALRAGAIALLVSLLLPAWPIAQDAASGDAAAAEGQTVQNMSLPGTVPETTLPTEEEGAAGAQTTTEGTTTGGTTTEGTTTGGTDTGTTSTSTTPTPKPPPGTDAPVRPSQTAGIAGSQPAKDRKSEWRQSCDKARWPISELSSIGGSMVTDHQDRWPWVLLVLAGLILVPLVVVTGRRRALGKAGPQTPQPDRSPPARRLETIATIVGIAVAVPAIAGLFFPGVGIRHHPAPRAAMAVREVQARITRGEFVNQAIPADERPTFEHPFDRQEVGHVVWVELDLTGFRHDDLTLTWASYSRASGYALIPQTSQHIRVEVSDDADAVTTFKPIWVGLPKQTFQVRFRLIDAHNDLLQVARTGDMRGSNLRYACHDRPTE